MIGDDLKHPHSTFICCTSTAYCESVCSSSGCRFNLFSRLLMHLNSAPVLESNALIMVFLLTDLGAWVKVWQIAELIRSLLSQEANSRDETDGAPRKR